ncbi:adenosylcobinamide-GDP ribazoletransferase [Yoonia sediminilitoris]|uniref:Adenosylcobinamide-GDP ribazoletransferase n=1 Tax=Yoonia sediminilitoris TaxID=1286148 RepID=A0A2T6KEU8_9RHOB|nr:adenosylcobinamide-GDP ribazoletransferase [Yoonia sediminilitoris]PUB13652.1 cobalamin-5'-phosphate synthase [Yoonia sediminilitoris]RCW94822.1 cobalamin-5'-phosphate synthase [Yoonia sediminilitoris]
MTNRDTTPMMTVSDVFAALGLLSRLPVPVDGEKATARGAAAAWAYPLAGLVIGSIVACVATAALWAGLGAPIAAALALATNVIITGAMHEDGLADSADGLWGGWEPARRLEIMKDSHIGVYGVTALALSFLLRWLALSMLIGSGLHWAAIISAAMLSRASMTELMAILPNARDTGLSKSVGRPTHAGATVAAVIGLAASLLLWGLTGLIVAVVAQVAALVCTAIAKAKIGGQTGDTLGATQQISEIAAFLAMVVLFSS